MAAPPPVAVVIEKLPVVPASVGLRIPLSVIDALPAKGSPPPIRVKVTV